MAAARSSKPKTRAADSAKTYTLKIATQLADDVYRTAEFSGESTFADLHDFIQRAFELDDEHMYAFFMTNRAWDRKDVIAVSVSERWERAAVDVRLREGALCRGKKFLYLFDFGDELRHDIEVVDIGKIEAGIEYPRLLESHGKAPSQYPADEDEESPELHPDFEPLISTFEGVLQAWDERQMADDTGPRPRDAVMAEVALARRLLGLLEGRMEQLDAVSDLLDLDIEDWLLDLPFDLLACDVNDVAVDLAAEIYARLSGVSPTASNVFARVLVRVGRMDQARGVGEELLARAREHEDLDAVDDAADIFALVSDDERAESLTREVLESDGIDLATRFAAQERLIELLRKRGAAEEADALEAAGVDASRSRDGAASVDEDAFDEEAFRAAARALANLDAARPQPVVVAAKPGRNDPCTCGSGKKFKKCCGA